MIINNQFVNGEEIFNDKRHNKNIMKRNKGGLERTTVHTEH